MSIAPPSDIILDVAQAADPLKVQVATAKLASLAAKPAGSIDDFAAVLAHQSKTTSTAPSSPLVRDYGTHRTDARPSSPYQKFEALVLQNFVETMLPKDKDLFGDTFSADAYRSMMADKLATQMASTGRLGIAQAIERKHGQSSAADLMRPTPPSTAAESAAAPNPSVQSLSARKV